MSAVAEIPVEQGRASLETAGGQDHGARQHAPQFARTVDRLDSDDRAVLVLDQALRGRLVGDRASEFFQPCREVFDDGRAAPSGHQAGTFRRQEIGDVRFRGNTVVVEPVHGRLGEFGESSDDGLVGLAFAEFEHPGGEVGRGGAVLLEPEEGTGPGGVSASLALRGAFENEDPPARSGLQELQRGCQATGSAAHDDEVYLFSTHGLSFFLRLSRSTTARFTKPARQRLCAVSPIEARR